MKINKKYYIYLGVITILVIGVFSINLLTEKKDNINDNISLVDAIEEQDTIEEEGFYVDIKGAVKKPGVYKVTSNMIVNDLIQLAGGLSKNAYTNNINLASKLSDGMVVYVYSNKEVTTTTTTTMNIRNDVYYDNTITNTNKTSTTDTTTSSKININTASKDELMTLSGVGESKAIAIIEYRSKNKFNTIEDIMNVSGIGESAFAKIKEFITV